MFSDSFAGIAPASVVGFMLAELAGAAIGVAIHEALKARAADLPTSAPAATAPTAPTAPPAAKSTIVAK